MTKRNGKAAPEEFFNYVLDRDYDMLDCCLEEGFDINSSGQDGMTALMIAVMDSSMEMADYLIEKGANIDDRHIGRFGLPHNALSVAYTMKPPNYLMVKYLLLKGARFDSGDLLLAQKDPKLLKLLKKFKGKNYVPKVQVDLYEAIERMPADMLDQLLDPFHAEKELEEAGIF